MAKYVDVLLPLAVDRTFSYSVADFQVEPGNLVEVPFRGKLCVGLVCLIKSALEDGLDEAAVKPISGILDAFPPLPAHYIKFINWVSEYNLSPKGHVFKLMQCASLVPPVAVRLLKSASNSGRFKKNYARVIDFLSRRSADSSLDEIVRECKVKKATIENMVKEGILELVPCFIRSDFKQLQLKNISLEGEQRGASEELLQFQISLLDGVTGSGKTEVYLSVVKSILLADESAQALIMLPEISLASHLVVRFRRYFGENIAEWHSGLGEAKRAETLQRVISGSARIVVGARSSLFLPYRNLRIIVLDEEHDSSYKQGNGVRYNARDMAIVLAKMTGIKLIMVSATPSLETVYNIQQGKVKRVFLTKRFALVDLPRISAIDMRGDKKRILSEELINLIRKKISDGEQTLLFLNRRGYSPLMLCHKCGYKVRCINCSVWLVYHEKLQCFMCHHCGYRMVAMLDCGHCGAQGSLVDVGLGIEKLEFTVRKLFAEARIVVLSGDSSFKQSQLAIEAILNSEADIVLGTQVITKGYHFPKLTLVGVVNGDGGLSSGDLRSSERTYQLLSQVSGRCGREISGSVVIQSYNPSSVFMQSLLNYDRDAFYNAELEERKQADMPPYTRLASVVIANKKAQEAERIAKVLAQGIPKVFIGTGIKVLGPVVAPLYLLKGYYRYRFLVVAGLKCKMQPYLEQWLGQYLNSKGVEVDIDPLYFA